MNCKVKGCHRPDGFGAKTDYLCFPHWQALPFWLKLNITNYALASAAALLKNELEYAVALLNQRNEEQ